jgi:hypothetical protein
MRAAGAARPGDPRLSEFVSRTPWIAGTRAAKPLAWGSRAARPGYDDAELVRMKFVIHRWSRALG